LYATDHLVGEKNGKRIGMKFYIVQKDVKEENNLNNYSLM
tara:strand:+ start:127 stop:246 length:120 start_codon:yes stop_codon:yes gene_type:complete